MMLLFGVLGGIKEVIKKWKPDYIFVHGDTTTSMTACLAGFYSGIKVAHIEAGLRTYNLKSPWPEEGNRQITGRLAHLHFSPTPMAKENLLREGIPTENIIVTGNTVIDALKWVINKIEFDTNSVQNELIDKGYTPTSRRKILVTGHRRENFGDGFIEICKALNELAKINTNIDIIYPVHLNPNVRKPVYELLTGIENIFLIEPLDYLPFAYLMSISDIILTDSGGIQEEAPSLGKPVLVMRDTTERPEAVDAGTVKLVGTNKDVIIREVNKLINDESEYKRMSQAHNPYGDGKACQRILEFMSKI
jgi:UDP-N-acetylglucosamine 2-epimerase (non-hydrolysing)